MKLVLDFKDAVEAGLVGCVCGHPINNHFKHGDRSCAHCADCLKLRLVARRGTLLEESTLHIREHGETVAVLHRTFDSCIMIAEAQQGVRATVERWIRDGLARWDRNGVRLKTCPRAPDFFDVLGAYLREQFNLEATEINDEG